MEEYDDLDELPAPPRKNIPEGDRQLLELAGRALGAIRFEEVDGEGYATLHFADGSTAHGWNPLQFGDDAFELAVKLELDVLTAGARIGNEIAAMVQDGYSKVCEVEAHSSDPSAATRRAIVRAAAEIGKQRS